MKYFLLITTILWIIGFFNSFKFKTVKDVADSTIKQVQKDKISLKSDDVSAIDCIILLSELIGLIYSIMIACYVGTALFTVIIALWIAWSIYDTGLLLSYIDNGTQKKLLNSYTYKIVERIVDFSVLAYVVYFVIMNW